MAAPIAPRRVIVAATIPLRTGRPAQIFRYLIVSTSAAPGSSEWLLTDTRPVASDATPVGVARFCSSGAQLHTPAFDVHALTVPPIGVWVTSTANQLASSSSVTYIVPDRSKATSMIEVKPDATT